MLIEKLRDPNEDLGRKLRDFLIGSRVGEDGNDLVGMMQDAVRNIERYRLGIRGRSKKARDR